MEGRDTQFLGFAESLAAEIANTDGWMLVDVEKLIAQRVYDLVGHALDHAFTNGIIFDTPEEAANQIPDITALPEVK